MDDDDDEEEEEEEELVVVLLLAPAAVPALVTPVVLDGLGGGAPWGAAAAAGGISREGAGFMCPVSGPARDRVGTWDTGEDRVPWVSPTPSVFLHATIAISTVSKSLNAQLSFFFYAKINANDLSA